MDRSSKSAAVVCGILMLGAVVPQAHAEEVAPERHCWLNVDTGDGGCFSSAEQVLSDISEGRQLTVLQGDETLVSVAPVSAQSAGSIESAAVFVLAKAWDNQGYSGAYYTFTANSDCDTNSDVDHSLPVMPTGWNDRISSFSSYGLCATKLWENGQFQGGQYGFYVTSSYVGGAMNDKASSLQWN